MAIIRCPECGHQVSDKAPMCPVCGVEIADKITQCVHCGNIYFKEEGACPHCHGNGNNTDAANAAVENNGNNDNNSSQQKVTQAAEPQNAAYRQNTATAYVPPVTPASNTGSERTDNNSPKKNNRKIIIISIIALAIIGAVSLYFYKDLQTSQEMQDYEFAMQSSDPLVLQNYLDRYKDAPEAHIDSIQAHLDRLKMVDAEWTNTLVNNSKNAFEEYLDKHPDTPYKSLIIHKIDSIDWEQTKTKNTIEAFQDYLAEHPNGEHVDEADTNIKELKTKTVLPEEKEMVQNVFRQFFQSINSRNENGLVVTLSEIITSFIGKENASRSDAVEFMNKLYKEDIASMNWRINGFSITKKEVGDEEYEYSVTFMALQDIVYSGDKGTKQNKYKISGKISPDGRISSLNMIKIIE